jgi:hypothetical protein
MQASWSCGFVSVFAIHACKFVRIGATLVLFRRLVATRDKDQFGRAAWKEIGVWVTVRTGLAHGSIRLVRPTGWAPQRLFRMRLGGA